MCESKEGLRVLVVDDEALIRWSIAENLAAYGHILFEAADGASALSMLSEGTENPDVVLLDYRLPDSNDLNLLRKVRQIAPDAAIILMTAFGTPEVFREALDLGAFCVLSKPFDLLKLNSLIHDAHLASPRQQA